MQIIDKIKQIYIDPLAKDYPLTKHVIAHAGNIPIQSLSKEKLFDKFSGQDPISSSKENLFITLDYGSQLKRCPGTKGRICCNYFVINQGIGCPFDCSYCFLQEFSNLPAIVIYANTEDIFKEVKNRLDEQPYNFFRIGTGEMTDSLSLDQLTGFTKEIVPFFSGLKNGILELKTKSNKIDELLKLDPKGNTVVSWSLNPQSIIDSDELDTASLIERLEAAKKVSEHGYHLAFHFDPMIYFDGWQNGYSEVVKLLKEYIDPKKIMWVSIGSFRYKPGMKKIMDRRFPQSTLTSGEHLMSNDGKMRYFKAHRIELYDHLVKELKSWYQDIFIYFCMENDDIWNSIFNEKPKNMAGVDKLFREAIGR